MSEEQPKPPNHWFHFPLQAVGIVFCVYFYFHLPKSGKALLVLSAIVAVMMLMDMRPVHKGIYVAIVLGLVLIENRALNKERADFAQDESKRRTEENNSFQGIADGIKADIKESQTHFDTTMSELRDVANTETGGDSFCYLDLYPAQNNVMMMTVVRKGKYPIRGVSMRISDRARSQLAVETYMKNRPANGLPPNPEEIFRAMNAGQVVQYVPDFATDSRYIGGYQMTVNERQSFDIVFSAFNGSWIERLEMRQVNGKWLEAIMVEHGRHPFLKIAPDYPRIDGKLDVPNWPRPVKGKPEWER